MAVEIKPGRDRELCRKHAGDLSPHLLRGVMDTAVLEDDPMLGARRACTEMGEQRRPCTEYLDPTAR
jgi:hypothetical protein